MKKSMKKTYKKRHHNRSRSRANKYTKRGGKLSTYKPIHLLPPNLPSSIDNTIQDIMDETANLVDYGGKPKSKKRNRNRYYKGGFKTDTVDDLEDRDDDWMITKQ
jgi:hypothetical protein